MSMSRIEHITIRAKDIIDLGTEQFYNRTAEFGGAIVGTQQGTHLAVDRIIPMGKGAKPDPDRFEIDRRLAEDTMSKVQRTGKNFFGIAHTHGPEVGDENPSEQDFVTANNYDICMLIKVDADGGGKFEFFDGQRRGIPCTIIGLDGNVYNDNGKGSDDVILPAACWGIAA